LERTLARERKEFITNLPEKRNTLYTTTLELYLSTVKDAITERVRQKPMCAEDDKENELSDEDEEDVVDANLPIFQRAAIKKQKRLYDILVEEDEDCWMHNTMTSNSLRSTGSASSYGGASGRAGASSAASFSEI
jgi:hypothetical protein